MPIDIPSIIISSVIKAIPNLFVTMWPLIVFLIFVFIYKIYLFSRLKKSGMLEIDKMTGPEFEKRLSILFSNLGYKVRESGKPTGDYGVDLVIEKNDIKTAVQAKCYKRQLVGEDAVREVYSGKNYYNCSEAIVITNSNFSRMAWQLAKSNKVKLWNRNYLTKVLLTEKAKISN